MTPGRFAEDSSATVSTGPFLRTLGGILYPSMLVEVRESERGLPLEACLEHEAFHYRQLLSTPFGYHLFIIEQMRNLGISQAIKIIAEARGGNLIIPLLGRPECKTIGARWTVSQWLAEEWYLSWIMDGTESPADMGLTDVYSTDELMELEAGLGSRRKREDSLAGVVREAFSAAFTARVLYGTSLDLPPPSVSGTLPGLPPVEGRRLTTRHLLEGGAALASFRMEQVYTHGSLIFRRFPTFGQRFEITILLKADRLPAHCLVGAVDSSLCRRVCSQAEQGFVKRI